MEAQPKLLDQIREVLRLKHLSFRTGEATSVGSNALFCFMRNAIPKTWEPPRSGPFFPIWPPRSMWQLLDPR